MGVRSKCKTGKDVRAARLHNQRKTWRSWKLESGIWRKRINRGRLRNEQHQSMEGKPPDAHHSPSLPGAKARPAPKAWELPVVINIIL